MDIKLKQRLIGGAVLIALAVIFLPMLVQGPAPDSGLGDVPTRVPAAPDGKLETRELPLGPAAGQAVLPAPASTPPASAPVGAPAGVANAPAAAAPASTPPDAAVAAGPFGVSFGAYASARDADAVLSRLRQAGLEGFKEQVEVNGRQAWRVRVGPYPDRALAEAGRLQAVRIRTDVNAQVIALDAGAGVAAAASDTTPTGVETPKEQPAPMPRAEASKPASQEPRPTAAVADGAKASPPAKPATDASAAKPKPVAAAPAPKPAPAPAAVAATDIGFAVQMGAFASDVEAKALRDRLRQAGYSAIVQPVRTDKGVLNRVRVGPVSTRAEAEQLKARLASGFGAGMVVSHP